MDGGELGAGHRVTALYEVKLAEQNPQKPLGKFSIAWKKPLGEAVQVTDKTIPASVVTTTAKASPDTRLSVAVAAFAEKLRQSYWSRAYDYWDIQTLLQNLPPQYLKQQQVYQLRELIDKAQHLDQRHDPFILETARKDMNFDRVPLLE